MKLMSVLMLLVFSLNSFGAVQFRSFWKIKDRQENVDAQKATELDQDSSLELYPQLSPDKNPLLWAVKGKDNGLLNSQCQKEGVREVFRKVQNGLSLQTELQNWSNDCQVEFNKNYQPGSLKALYDHTMQSAKLSRLKQVQSFALELKDGRKLIGIMGKHSGEQKRPLIVGRCGLFCNGHTGANIESFIPVFFEEVGANFILLESVSHKGYIERNKALAITGADEGAQTFQIIQGLRDYFPMLAEVTSDVHLVGESLGGHGALYGSLYASMNPSEFPIKSVLALCPVVDLQTQVNFLFKENTLRKNIVTFFFFRLAQVLSQSVSSLSAAASLEKPNSEEVKILLNQSNWDFYSKNWNLIGANSLKPLQGLNLSSEEDFNQASNFVNWAQFVRVPTLVIANQDDMVVSFNANAKKLIGQSSNVNVLSVAGGNHCGFAEHMGYGAYSQIIKQWIGLHSSRSFYSQTLSLEKVQFSNLAQNQMQQLKPFTSYEWNILVGSEVARLSAFSESLAVDGNSRELGELMTLEVPLRFFAPIGFPKRVKNKSEAAALSRFLNANVFARSKQVGWTEAGGAPSHFDVQGRFAPSL